MQDKQRIINLEQSVKELTNQQQSASDNLDELREQHNELVTAIEKNDSTTAQELHDIKKLLTSLRDLLQAWNDAKGFVKVIGYIATFIKWTTVIGSAIGIIWLALKNGVDVETAKEITGSKK